MTYDESHDQPAHLSKVERLFQSGECWTGDGPKDVDMPGHVVLILHKGEEPRYLGPKWVGRALDQIFGGKDAGIYRVGGFCR